MKLNRKVMMPKQKSVPGILHIKIGKYILGKLD